MVYFIFQKLSSNHPNKADFQNALRNAKTYEDWREAALKLDVFEGNNLWKNDLISDDYNYKLIQSRIQELSRLKENKNITELIALLKLCE